LSKFRNFPKIVLMKKFLFACLAVAALMVTAAYMNPQPNISGAWSLQDGTKTKTLVITDDYLSMTTFDKENKKFYETKGGVVKISGNKLTLLYEFSTTDNGVINTSVDYTFDVQNGNLVLTQGNTKETYKRVDDNKGPLAGVWYMSGRVVNDVASAPRPYGPRKTVKIMSGTRFQWVQVNTENKQTGASGGGTYTFENGKYTEHIEFFTRDSSRVGMSLSFEDRVEGKDWHHTGKSSTGQPMHEIWTRAPKQ
jgi:hypothetical protein